MPEYDISNVRVLIVEGEPLIALDVEQLCIDAGASAVTISGTVSHALAVPRSSFDVAILDHNVAGESTLPIARELQASRIPFIFTSGMIADAELAEFPQALLVAKPYSSRSLLEAIVTVLSSRYVSGGV